MNSEEDYLLQLAEFYLNKALDVNNQNFLIDYRVSVFAISNFYNLMMLNVGKELNKTVKESYPFEKKIFIVSQELPELLTKYDSLFRLVKDLRERISHTDISIPNKNDISMAVKQAKEFKTYLIELATARKNRLHKKLSLKEKYQEKIDFVKLLFQYPDKQFRENFFKQSENIKSLFEKLEYYQKIDIDNLNDKSIESLLYFLELTLKEAESIFDDLYNHCPKCGGELVSTTESKTHYTGPYDDPEPHSFTVWQVIKCKNCGEIIEKEHITTESI